MNERKRGRSPGLEGGRGRPTREKVNRNDCRDTLLRKRQLTTALEVHYRDVANRHRATLDLDLQAATTLILSSLPPPISLLNYNGFHIFFFSISPCGLVLQDCRTFYDTESFAPSLLMRTLHTKDKMNMSMKKE